MLDALARLGPRHGDVAYVVVGDGPEKRRLEARARQLGLSGRVTFLGWRSHDEVLGLMARADAFVLPSSPEGFGLVYAEAMAQGTPVVACRGEGPDDFIGDGVSGLLVPPGDSDAVARAIARLLDEPATAARLAAGRPRGGRRPHLAAQRRAPARDLRARAGRAAGGAGGGARMTSPIPVVHLSVVHRPDDTRIHERECRTLAEAGYDVTYLVPGATAGRDDHGVRLASLPVRSRTRRFLSSRQIVAALRALRPFVVHTHDPELLTLFPLLRPFVPRLVCDVHEHVAGAVVGKEYIPAGARRAVSAASRSGAARARSLGRRRRRRLRRHAPPAGSLAPSAPRRPELPALSRTSTAPRRSPISPPIRDCAWCTSARCRACVAAASCSTSWSASTGTTPCSCSAAASRSPDIGRPRRWPARRPGSTTEYGSWAGAARRAAALPGLGRRRLERPAGRATSTRGRPSRPRSSRVRRWGLPCSPATCPGRTERGPDEGFGIARAAERRRATSNGVRRLARRPRAGRPPWASAGARGRGASATRGKPRGTVPRLLRPAVPRASPKLTPKGHRHTDEDPLLPSVLRHPATARPAPARSSWPGGSSSAATRSPS